MHFYLKITYNFYVDQSILKILNAHPNFRLEFQYFTFDFQQIPRSPYNPFNRSQSMSNIASPRTKRRRWTRRRQPLLPTNQVGKIIRVHALSLLPCLIYL